MKSYVYYLILTLSFTACVNITTDVEESAEKMSSSSTQTNLQVSLSVASVDTIYGTTIIPGISTDQSSVQNSSSSEVQPISSIEGVSSSVVVVIEDTLFSNDSLIGDSGVFVDDRDKQRYRWIKIGPHYWMQDNLNYLDNQFESFTGVDEYAPSYADGTIKNGLYYKLYYVMNKEESSNDLASTVQGLCPVGWHIPSKAEYYEFVDYIGLNSASQLKVQSEWNIPGVNTLHFDAVPSGYGRNSKEFYNFGQQARFWLNTKTAEGISYFYFTLVDGKEEIALVPGEMFYAHSVRCVADLYDGVRKPSPDYSEESGSITDARDDTEYKWVGIGPQKWLAEDLRYTNDVPFFTDDSIEIFYTWATALSIDTLYNYESAPDSLIDPENHQGLCPEGWRTPNTKDFGILSEYLGGYEVAGRKLKAASFGGTNETGFNAYMKGVWRPETETKLRKNEYIVATTFGSEVMGRVYTLASSNSSALEESIRDKVLFGSVRCIMVDPT